MSALVKIAVPILVAICLIALGVHLIRNAHREAQLRRLAAESLVVTTAEGKLANDVLRQSTLVADAQQVSQKRHDAMVAGDTAASDLIGFVKTETADVSSASDLNETIEADAQAVAQDYASIYGDGAAAKFNADIGSMHDACANELDDWSTAAGDIKDSMEEELQGRFSFSSSDVEQYYTNASHEEVRCDRLASTTASDMTSLDKRIKADIGALQASTHSF